PQGWRAVAWPFQQLRVLGRHSEMRAAIIEFFPSTALLQGATLWHGVAAISLMAMGLLLALRRSPTSSRVRGALALLVVLLWLVIAPPGLRPWPYRLTSALALAAACELPFAVRERRWFPALTWSAAVVLALPLIRNLTLLPPTSLWLLLPLWRLPPRWAPALAGLLSMTVAWARLSDRLPPGTSRAPGWTGWGMARDIVPLGAAAYLAR